MTQAQPNTRPKARRPRTRSRAWPKWLAAGAVVALVAFFAWRLPRGYSTDLSAIGQGEAAVVLVHDHYLVESVKLMDALDKVRGHYAGRIKFLVADMSVAPGREFARRYGVGAVTLLLFAPDGKLLKTIHGAQSPASLEREFDAAFGARAGN